MSKKDHALQIDAQHTRMWADDDGGLICRQWYFVCLELYPHGKVVNDELARPSSRFPTPAYLLSFLLRHMHSTPPEEVSISPTHVSFLYESETLSLKPDLARLQLWVPYFSALYIFYFNLLLFPLSLLTTYFTHYIYNVYVNLLLLLLFLITTFGTHCLFSTSIYTAFPIFHLF